MSMISCIMPLYNSSRYMDKCIQSVLNQTFKDFELIIVEDCSTDDSLVKCEQYVENDSRVRLIRNEKNKGAAVSRNTGLTYATGEYVIFLDADDYFYPKMLEKCYNKAKETGVDMVVFGFEQYQLDENDQMTSHHKLFNVPDFKLIKQDEITVHHVQTAIHSPWNKFVKKELLILNNIQFQDIPSSNDGFYTWATVICSKSLYYYNEILISNLNNAYGISSTHLQKQTNIFKAYLEILKFISEKHKMSEDFIWDFINIVFQSFSAKCSSPDYSLKYKNLALIDFNKFLEYMESNYKDNIKLNQRNNAFYNELKSDTNIFNINSYSYTAVDKIKRLKDLGAKIAVWGFGQYGKNLINSLLDNDICIDGIIDSNKQKQGAIYFQYKICSYEDICDEIDTVIVTNMRYYYEISEEAKGKNVIYIE